MNRRSNDQLASWSANIETEDRSLRSDQAHARVPWSTRSARQSFTWQSGATGGRSSSEKRKEARQGNAPLPNRVHSHESFCWDGRKTEIRSQSSHEQEVHVTLSFLFGRRGSKRAREMRVRRQREGRYCAHGRPPQLPFLSLLTTV